MVEVEIMVLEIELMVVGTARAQEEEGEVEEGEVEEGEEGAEKAQA